MNTTLNSLKAMSVNLVIADDDEEDRELIEEALRESKFKNKYTFVEDGEQLMDYLKRNESSSGKKSENLPSLILLDLNMPKKDGRQVLKEIKDDPKLKKIPVVVLTTSRADKDIMQCYNLGVSSFISKPTSFTSMIEIMKTLNKYWFEIVELPSPEE